MTMKPIKENLTEAQIKDNGLGPRLHIGDDWMPEPYVDFKPGPRFERWLTEVAKLLGVEVHFDVPLEKSSFEDLRHDESWYWAFDDGMKPEEAVAEFRAQQKRSPPT